MTSGRSAADSGRPRQNIGMAAADRERKVARPVMVNAEAPMSDVEPTRVALYSDAHCPYAYLTAYRLRRVLPEYRDRVVVEFKSLALEHVNAQPTPKPILDNETPLLMLEEPDIPYQPWHAPTSEWPVTMWPAFEAIKCVERQGPGAAAALDWAIRMAFFAESRCISMRQVKSDVLPPMIRWLIETMDEA